MYNIGEKVVYKQMCVCEIAGIETLAYGGDGDKKYYKVCPVFENSGDTVYHVPVDFKEGLRAVTSASDAQSIIEELSKIKVTVPSFKKPLQLNAHYQELYFGGGLKEILTMLKEIALKEATSKKKLSEIDMRYRAKAENLVSEEISVALSLTKEGAKELLQKTVCA